MPVSRTQAPSGMFLKLESWAHYNDAGQLIASGERSPDGVFCERLHLPFDLVEPPFVMLKSDDHMDRVTAERIIWNMFRCLDMKSSG